MVMAEPRDKDEYTEEETARRRDAVLKIRDPCTGPSGLNSGAVFRIGGVRRWRDSIPTWIQARATCSSGKACSDGSSITADRRATGKRGSGTTAERRSPA